MKPKDQLLKIFDANNFDDRVFKEEKHTKEVLLHTCSNGSKVYVSFPGYKAYFNGRKVIYDYRLDLEKDGVRTALSHANIVVDIYNKIVHGGMEAEELKQAIIEIFEREDDAVYELTYSPIPPNKELMNRVTKAHNRKQYNRTGNSFDLTVEELTTCIKWIVIQEDINYPIRNGFEGRKMCLSRYMEAVFTAQNNNRVLEEVIERTLSHKRPEPWVEMDYSFKDNIV